MSHVRRLAPSTSRVTEGKIYALRHDGRIIDDEGNPMRPQLKSYGDHSQYWETLPDEANLPSQFSVKQSAPTNEEKNMPLLIKNAILVNGTDSDNLSTEQVLELIEVEEGHLNRLNTFTVLSKAIDSLKDKHIANIGKLVAIIDKRGADTL